MYKDSQSELDKIFMSYNKILLKFKALNIKTKSGKEITHINDKIKVTKKGKIKITKNGYFFDCQK